MALVPDQKFSTFQDGGDLDVGDIVVGLRNGLNTKFNYTGELPPSVVIPISNGGTGATTAPQARINLGLGTMATQAANDVDITGGTAALDSGQVVAVPTNPTDIVNKQYLGTMAVQNANAVNITGGTAALTSGQVASVPSANTDIANKLYVDNALLNLNTFTSRVATTANLSATYAPGSSGIGATLTATANGAASIDGISLAVNDVVLFKNQSSALQNGLYYLSTNGTGGTPSIFTRSTDYDQPSEIQAGDLVSVVSGTVNASSSWQQTATVTAVGTDPITFTKFSQYGVLPSPFTVGSTSVTTSGTQLNLLNTLTLVPINKITTQIFTASGTYTPTSGMKYCYARVLGGGGGGGGGVGNATGCGMGAGGGAGAEVTAWLTAATIGVSQTVTIGTAGTSSSGGNGTTGGATSLGSLMVAGAGSGGNVGATSSAATFSVPGLGGALTTVQVGQIGKPGENGLTGFTILNAVGIAGNGAPTSCGAGGRGATNANTAGANATNYGDGGGGGYAGTLSVAGGTGGTGLVFIVEYCAA